MSLIDAPSSLIFGLLLGGIVGAAFLTYRTLWRRRRLPAGILIILRSMLLLGLFVVLFRPVAEKFIPIDVKSWLVVLFDESASMAFPDENGRPRHEELAKGVEEFRAGIADKTGVVTIAFGEHARIVDSAAAIRPSSGATDFEEAFRLAGNVLADRPAAGLLVVSDGSSTKGDDVSAAFESLIAKRKADRNEEELPVFVLPPVKGDKGFGIVNVDAPVLVRNDREFEVGVELYGDGPKTVMLFEMDRGGKRKLAEETTDSNRVMLSALPPGRGRHNLVVEVTSSQGKGRDEDARFPFAVHVLSEPRVVLAAGQLSWEYKYLRQAIEKMRNIDETVIVVSGDRLLNVYGSNQANWNWPSEWKSNDFGGVDVLIMIDLPFDSINSAGLEALHERLGGGAIGLVVAGTEGWSEELPEWMPVEKLEKVGNGYRVMPVGEAASGLKESLPMIGSNEKSVAFNPSRAGVGIAEYNGAPGSPSAVMEGRVGLGRVLLIGSEIWRSAVEHGEEERVRNFWQASIRSALPQPGIGFAFGELPQQVSPGDKVEFTIATEPGVEEVNYEIEGPELERTGKIDGSNTVSFVAKEPGEYFIRAWTDNVSNAVGKTVVADPIFREYQAPERDLAALEKLTKSSGGRMLTPESLTDLAKNWDTSGSIMRRTTNDLWDHPFVFACLGMIWLTEWILRRRWTR